MNAFFSRRQALELHRGMAQFQFGAAQHAIVMELLTGWLSVRPEPTPWATDRRRKTERRIQKADVLGFNRSERSVAHIMPRHSDRLPRFGDPPRFALYVVPDFEATYLREVGTFDTLEEAQEKGDELLRALGFLC
jgi:hypothetical protein